MHRHVVRRLLPVLLRRVRVYLQGMARIYRRHHARCMGAHAHIRRHRSAASHPQKDHPTAAHSIAVGIIKKRWQGNMFPSSPLSRGENVSKRSRDVSATKSTFRPYFVSLLSSSWSLGSNVMVKIISGPSDFLRALATIRIPINVPATHPNIYEV